jgi:serine/threonine protein kinase
MAVESHRAKAIFLQAVEKATPAERDAFLAEACAGNEELTDWVRGLLQAHEASCSVLDRPAPEQFSKPAELIQENQLVESGRTSLQDSKWEPTSGACDADQVLSLLALTKRQGSLGRLGHYEMLEILGQGGFATVFRAFDEKLHRIVAVKVLAPVLAANATSRARFLREARAAAAVRDEHVIDIHAVEEQPSPYLVMEYIEGQTLQQKLDKTGPLSVKEILRIGFQTAVGLSAAHKQGLIHRDIKPSNILLENGVERVKLSDFGLARTVDDASVSRSGLIAGTPLYMSPEQAAGNHVDHRTDLFSLGSVLYALCTGHSPFRADSTLGVLKRVTEDKPRPIQELNDNIPECLAAVVYRLLAKDPNERFSSACQIADLLASYLSELQTYGQVLSAHEGLAPENEQKTRTQLVAQRKPSSTILGLVRPLHWLVFACIVVALSAVTAAVVHRYVPNSKSGPSPRAEAPAPAPYAQPLPPQPQTPASKTEPQISPVYRAGPLRKLPDPAELAMLAATADVLNPKDIPANLLAHAGDGNPDDAPAGLVAILGNLDEQPRQVLSVAFSPNGKFLASGAGDKSVRLWDLAKGTLHATLASCDAAVLTVAFSPDGSQLASGDCAGVVHVFDVATGMEQRAWLAHGRDIRGLMFSPNGKILASTSYDGTLKLWDPTSGKLNGWAPMGGRAWCLAFSPDGKTLAVGQEAGVVALFDVATGALVAKLPGHNAPVRCLAFHPDGQSLAAGTDPPDQAIHLWDLVTLQEKQLVTGHTSGINSCAWRADGGMLASCGFTDGTVRLWDVGASPPRSRSLQLFPDGMIWLHSLALSPEGRYLATANPDGTIYILKLAERGTVLRIAAR